MKEYLIITGASRGLGLHIANCALAAGYEVVGLARSKTDDFAFPMFTCDVSDSDAVAQTFRQFRKLPVYGLINAAGAASMNLHLTTPARTMRRLVEVNLLGTMFCSQEGGRILARRKTGRIINFSSVAVALGLAGESAYVAAKAGIEGFTRSFAREMAHFNVTVNAIAPGPVPTALIAGVPPEKIDDLRKRQVSRKPLVPADIWNLVSLLLDGRSGCLSGEVLYAGGI